MGKNREKLAKDERKLHLIHALSELQQDLAASLMDPDDEGAPYVARSVGTVQYVTELMIAAGDVPPEVIIQGMYEIAQRFSAITQYQPIKLLKEIEGRFEVNKKAKAEAH